MTNIFDNVKKLRDITGIGIVECKSALLASNNNIDNAVIYLRQKGTLVATGKSSRTANEGVVHVFVKDDKKSCVILEVRCETDFISRSFEFIGYCDNVGSYFLSSKFFDQNFILYENEIVVSQELNDLRVSLISKFKENIFIKRVYRQSASYGFLFSYVHLDRIGVILNISVNDGAVALDILMQIAAMNPKYIDIGDVPNDILLSEKSIYSTKFKNQYPDKDALLLNKMIDGQVNKFFKDNVLLEQVFIKDAKKNVRYFLNNVVCVNSFVRFELGEN